MGAGKLHELLVASQHADMWATPSVLPDQPNLDLWLDQSISNSRLGSPLEHSGAFAVLEALAAEARGADRAWPLTQGSTIGNQIAMCALTRQFRAPRVLAAANCHHSVINAATLYGVSFRYLPGRMLAGFDAMLPATSVEVAEALDADPSITAVWVSSPTYEGLVADIEQIAAVAHARRTVLIVDAAWGSHFGFHPDLPNATAALGADLVVESTHKNGGGLQGTAMLLQSGGNVDPAYVDWAYRMVPSTSQSLLLLASLEWALDRLQSDGKRYLDIALQHATELRYDLAEIGIPVLTHSALADLTKVTFGGLPGYRVQQHLSDQGIIIEKAGMRSATMLATMQLRDGAAVRAQRAIDEIRNSIPSLDCVPQYVDVAGWLDTTPAIEPYVAARSRTEFVALTDSIGRIAADLVELYPPGIPVLAPGWRITQAAVDALTNASGAGARVVPNDVNSIAVLQCD